MPLTLSRHITCEGKMAQGKRWVFTRNNYTEEEEQVFKDVFASEDVEYGIFGRESGEGGTKHLQGFVIFATRKRLSQVRAAVGARGHYEIARRTPRKASEYCRKEGDVFEHGECPAGNEAVAGSRKRNRDEIAREFREAFKGGRGQIEQFAEDNPGVWQWSGRTLVANSLEFAPVVQRPGISVEWTYGAPGVGKSRLAHERMPDAYVKDPRNKCWNGYMLETQVIIEDFGPKGIDINHLLRWFDRYKCNVEYKAGMMPLYAEQWIVTSNFHPRDIFKYDHGTEDLQLPALLRRLKVTHMVSFAPNQ
ncbi:Replication-associated protein [Porphyridium purpureum]|uniref:Replication-associated protein n=1 Tax=Porphyridium purpureum TaxID=35688 RepID=A0A5J4Z8S8_PORPP|nr:Replication-associated protein [Porphyridium purpureum]|eukprot:POR3220..scf295_1